MKTIIPKICFVLLLTTFSTAYAGSCWEGDVEDCRVRAEQGDASAQFNLGWMYGIGQGVPWDDKEAVKWYRKAAEQGDANAQVNLGWRYANGLGVPQDDKQALNWYRKSAEQGHAKAQNNLGWMYYDGRGVLQDEKEARKWWKKSAEQGGAKAQSILSRSAPSSLCDIKWEIDAKELKLVLQIKAKPSGPDFAYIVGDLIKVKQVFIGGDEWYITERQFDHGGASSWTSVGLFKKNIIEKLLTTKFTSASDSNLERILQQSPINIDISHRNEKYQFYKYQDRFYLIIDDEYELNSPRLIYQIDNVQHKKTECGRSSFVDQTTYLKVYQKYVEEITEGQNNCGSASSYWNRNNLIRGRNFLNQSMANPEKVITNLHPSDIEIKHFQEWKFGDIWSYRKYETFLNAKDDATKELEIYYIDKKEFSAEKAKKIAQQVIQNIPPSYYALSHSGYRNKENSLRPIEELARGQYGKLPDIKQYTANTFTGTAIRILVEDIRVGISTLTTLVDYPKQTDYLRNNINIAEITTDYGKDLLMFAAHMNNLDAVKYFIENGWIINKETHKQEADELCTGGIKRFNRTALTYAAENASIDLILYLLSKGANINQLDSESNKLDFYINKNPRFSQDEKALGFAGIVKKYTNKLKTIPSFSCSIQLNLIEQAICDSEGLSIYDHELSIAYRNARKHLDSKLLKQSQITWIKHRAKECKTTKSTEQLNGCIAVKTRARTRYLNALLNPAI